MQMNYFVLGTNNLDKALQFYEALAKARSARRHEHKDSAKLI